MTYRRMLLATLVAIKPGFYHGLIHKALKHAQRLLTQVPLLKTELLEFSLPTGPIECELVRGDGISFVQRTHSCVCGGLASQLR